MRSLLREGTAFTTVLPLRSSTFDRTQSPQCEPIPISKCKRSSRTAPVMIAVSELTKHKLGSSDLQVTNLCLGTMTWGTQNKATEAEEQMDYAFKERGVNFLDSAEVYPVPFGLAVPGMTERIIGDYLAKQSPSFRQNLIIATKVAGPIPQSIIPAARKSDDIDIKSPPPSGPTRLIRNDIIAACDASLRRLKTDYIDLYQLHWPDRYVPIFGARVYDPSKERENSTPVRETLRGIKELLDTGKIRAYGLSNETTYGVAEFVRAADELGMPRPCSIQNQFCLFNRSFEADLAEACAPSHYNISLLPYSVLGGGVLSGKYLDKMGPDGTITDPTIQNSRLVKYPNFMGRYRSDAATKALRDYIKIAEDAGLSLAKLAQAFCKSRFFIDSSIIGATNVDQLKENIDAFTVDLDEEILAKIDEVHFANKDLVICS